MSSIITRMNIFLFSCMLNTVTFANSVTSHPFITAKPTAIQVDNAIQRAATYLMRHIDKRGQFEYLTNMDSSVKLEPTYNMLRHAGTLFAMSTYYENNPSQEMKSAIERGGNYLVKESIAPVAKHKNMLAVWSRPDVIHSNAAMQAKLGGTGLGLVALLSADKMGVEAAPLETLQALGNFLVYMQNPDGSFVSKYVPSQGGKYLGWESLYYPGEAALGLVMLYQKDGDKKWLVSAAKTLQFLANKRKGSSDVEADHWALLATEKLLTIDVFDTTGVSRELLINHGIQIVNAILESQITATGSVLYGGFTTDGRVTPAATRLEGLLAAYNFIPKTHKVSELLAKAIPVGMFFLVRAQIVDGALAGGFPRAVTKLEGNTEYTHNFNRRATEVRIDYIQHALSALMQYRKFINKVNVRWPS